MVKKQRPAALNQAEIGRGGMGVVHRAHDRLLDRAVAVKLLSNSGLGTSGRSRLLREAQAAARLQHPNIVAVFDAGEFNGTPAIIMELVDGSTLEHQAPADVDAVIRIGAAVAAALEHAHQHGVLHRDVKPGNIVLGADGSAKLMDFGLAYSAATTHLTQEEQPGGTALYMAPELLHGERATAQSDLYGLGATLYELAAGRPPFEGEDLATVISQHLHAPVTPPSAHRAGLPPALDDLIARLLSKSPEDRPASAAEARQVLERLARGEAVETEAPAQGEAPYRGLEAFDEADAGRFFGRERLVARLVGRLREARLLVVVVGASGSGKSSVVRAGLVAALRRGDPLADGTLPPAESTQWPIHVITPTARPLQALAERLTTGSDSVTATLTLMDDLAADPRSLHMFVRRLLAGRRPDEPGADAGRLMLVVDQFEELFTLCREEDDRRAFIDNLLYAASPEAGGPTVVVVTLRADFYAHCAAYPKLREALARHQEYIGPMSSEELRRAIEAPAEHGGWTLEAGLVELLLKEVGDEPGALPLLSHALLETWQRRRGRRLTLRGYTESGGVRGAIAQTAETVFGQLTLEQQAIARNLFLRLTELGEGTQDTRRRATRAELVPRPEDQAAVEAVLQRLSQARLITAGRDTVEVAHEALIREWPTLRGWLAENRDGLRLHRHLTETAAEWQRLGRDPGELYRGARLAQALEWAQFSGRAGDLNQFEREFLDASQSAAEQEIAEREAQHQRELAAARREAESAQQLTAIEQRRSSEQIKANRQLRRLAVGLTVLLSFAALAGGLAYQQNQRAQNEAHLARAHEWAAEAMNQLTIDPERSVLLALHALEESRAAGEAALPAAEEALHRAVQASRVLLTLPHDELVLRAGFTADGRHLVTVDAATNVRIWAIDDPALVQQKPDQFELLDAKLAPITLDTSPLALSHDATRVAVAETGSNNVLIWKVFTGQVEHRLHLASAILAVTFSPDDSKLAVSTVTGDLVLWDVDTGEQISSIPAVAADNISFNPSGNRVALSNRGVWTLTVLDPISGKSELVLEGHRSGLLGAVFSPDGRNIVTTSFDNTLRVWDANTGKQLSSVYEPAWIPKVAFSPDGQHLVVALSTGSLRMLGTADYRELYSLEKHGGWINAVAFSPNGTRLVTASADVKVWNASDTQEWLAFKMPTVSRVSAGSIDTFYDMDVGLTATQGQYQVAAAALRHVQLVPGVTQDSFGVYLWDFTSGAVSRKWEFAEPHLQLAFSPDGTKLATASFDGTAKIWETQLDPSYRPIAAFRGEGAMTAVAFYPDGQRLVASDCRGNVYVWDWVTTEVILQIQTIDMPETCEYYDAYSPLWVSADGSLLVALGHDRQVRLYDAQTGEFLHQLKYEAGQQIYTIAMSADGQFLATGTNDSTIVVWDIKTVQPVQVLTGHGPLFTSLAFSPDGELLASGGSLTTLWDWKNDREKLTIARPEGGAASVAFSPDGKFLSVAGVGSAVQVYLTQLEDLVALARTRLTRRLTPEECQQYLRLEQCPPLPKPASR